MKKIDLHIHTVSSDLDAAFDFSLDRLLRYIFEARLDCIAITNHNLFRKKQFNEISEAVDIPCYAGIEIDIENAQILLYSDGIDVDDFETRCEKVESHFEKHSRALTFDELKEIFGDLSSYLIIPHYDKKPSIRPETLEKFGGTITAGEVSSPKKFVYCIKDEVKLVPVYFSDCRISKQLSKTPTRQTFIDCGQVTFGALRNCLADKTKVALSPEDGNSLFQAFDDGQMLSTGLNVVLGERSSGKSHTLRRLVDAFDHVKFIEQFSIVSRNDEEDKRKFNEHLSRGNSLHSRDYLTSLNGVVDDMLDVDILEDERKVDEYLETLFKFANEVDKRDAFSSAVLFQEQLFDELEQKGLDDLIASTKNLIRNEEFRGVIERHLQRDQLVSLYLELMTLFKARDFEQRKKSWVNDLVREVKEKLQFRSATPSVSEVDLYQTALNQRKVAKFKKIVEKARQEREISRKSLRGFDVVASVGPFRGAGELKAVSKSQVGFSEAFKSYDDPYVFLQALKAIDERVPAADYHKYFVNIEYRILNKDGLPASGGQRSEFFLLQEISDAQNYDILLIDEPESSFDNLFLKNEVNAIIKSLSQTMPVVVVTHNNTVGASVRPDYVLCTTRELIDDKPTWRIYSGYPTSPKLYAVDGSSISTRDTLLQALEAGKDAYYERKSGYENIKD